MILQRISLLISLMLIDTTIGTWTRSFSGYVSTDGIDCKNLNVTLNSSHDYIYCYYTTPLLQDEYIAIITAKLYCTWSDDQLIYTLGTFQQILQYTSPSSYVEFLEGCTNTASDTLKINFTIQYTPGQKHDFKIINANGGQVIIQNFDIFQNINKCHVQCKTCMGEEVHNCLSCLYGSPTNGKCPDCPIDTPYNNFGLCLKSCSIDRYKYRDGVCQSYPIKIIYTSLVKDQIPFWTRIYDYDNVDTSLQIIQTNIYGIFKQKQGVQTFISLLGVDPFLEQILIVTLTLFNQIPDDNCGIHFKFNNSYIGSIFYNSSGLQEHNVQVHRVDLLAYGYLQFTQLFNVEIFIRLNQTSLPFLFTAVGNYTDSNAGWGIIQTQVVEILKLSSCATQVHFECQTCKAGDYLYRDGTCIDTCNLPYQNRQGTFCKDFDDETKYSKYITKEYILNSFNPNYYQQYQLISSTGINFLTGNDIYYSQISGQYIFGGPLVWAQAKFQSVYSQLQPHHSITIGFQIIFGPSFPQDGQFIYQIEQNVPTSKIIPNTSITCFGQKCLRVYEKVSHNLNSLTIYYECFGANNEPINAYCAFYNLYIAIHQCQPYCLQCTDENTCTQWSSDYNSATIQFDYDCQSNQYYDKSQLLCLQCPLMCQTCKTFQFNPYYVACLTCLSTATVNKFFECSCKLNQYVDNNQCLDCSYQCSQCLSINQCIDCLSSNNRYLKNGQCICFEGYYEVLNDPICQVCHYTCQTCSGPSNIDCLTCDSTKGLQMQVTSCKCQDATFYSLKTLKCEQCHSKCLTCFGETDLQCLSCNSLDNRVLKRFQCVCQNGYYEQGELCLSCPNDQDNSLSQCFNLCIDNSQIWHSIECSDCNSGFNLINNECIPICGDLLIVGYEQCDDGNNIMFDSCYQCQFQCPVQCATCDSNTILPCPDICGDNVVNGIEECDDGNNIQYDGCYECKFQCQQACTKCVLGNCLECGTKGWQVNPTNKICEEVCGDGYVVGQEQCDDMNTRITDGCKNCKYFCREGCLECDYTTNKCLKCNQGLYPENYYCKGLCGDQVVANDPTGYYNEDCDDGNKSNYNGCVSCRFQSNVVVCNLFTYNTIIYPEWLPYTQTLCSQCKDGYQLNQDLNRCEPICNDNLRVSLEVCDDSLSTPYKCRNCQPFCQNSCQACNQESYLSQIFQQQTEGCKVCKQGYILIDNLCYSVCGDKYITNDEECDDGNLNPFDGCHQCRFSCQESCLYCFDDQCALCDDDYLLFDKRCYKNRELLNSKIESSNNQNIDSFEQDNIYNFQNQIQIEQTFIIIKYNLPTPLKSCNLQQFSLYVEPYQFKSYQGQCQHVNEDKICLKNCLTCNNQECIQCEEGYSGTQCDSICGDGILTQEEQCDILSENSNCFGCMHFCTSFCNSCTSDVCLECQSGYHLNEVDNACQPQCGDLIVTSNEQCDDGNDVEYDGCNECKFRCQNECDNCEKGQCKKCQKSFFLIESKNFCEEIPICDPLLGFHYNSQDNKCYSSCGDGIIVEPEQCDDRNEVEFDGCFKCKLWCNQNCLKCEDGICILCDKGYEIQDSECHLKTQCGDGFKFSSEECDDGNNLPRDGCTNCKIDPNYNCQEIDYKSQCYQCQENCQECLFKDNQVQCIKCISGFFLQSNTCVQCAEKCEECEKTPSNCLKCKIQGCGLCEKKLGLYLDDQASKCKTLCGDGIKAEQEECDDGNLVDRDGCNQKCELEKEFKCDSNGCFVPPKKKITFEYINSTSVNSFVLQYDELQSNICFKLEIFIEKFEKVDFNFSITIQKGESTNSSECQVDFMFFKTIDKFNLIHILIPLSDSRILDEDQREIVIVPRKTIFYSEEQIATAQSVSETATDITFYVQISGLIAVILGGFNIFWAILDIFTWINNFYYLNIDYPLNVKIFFNQFKLGDMFQLPEFYHLNNPNDDYYFEGPPKFTEKGVNPLFLNNIQLFVVLITLACVGYIISLIIIKLLTQNLGQIQYSGQKYEMFQIYYFSKTVSKQFQQQKEEQQTQKKKKISTSISIQILKELTWFVNNFRAKLLQIINLVFLDICLACIFQFLYVKNQHYIIIIINIVLSTIGSLFIVYVFYIYNYVCSQHTLLYEFKRFQNYYSSLYEGINIKSKFARQYCLINLVRKAFFIFFLSFFYEIPLLQTSTCCLSCFLNLAFIIYENPFETNVILFQNAIPDLGVFIITSLSVLLAVQDQTEILTFDQKQIIGWVILATLGISILFQMIFLIQIFLLESYSRLQSLKNYCLNVKTIRVQPEK